MPNIKKNLALWVGLAIPIIMVLLIVVSVSAPKLFAHPKYSFLFTISPSSDPYRYPYPPGSPNTTTGTDVTYQVSGGKIIQVPQTFYYYSGGKAPEKTKLYLYDIQENKSKEISFADAAKYTVDGSSISPDGYEITPGTSGGGIFPFFYDSYNDYSSRYLRKNFASVKLNLPTPVGRYGYDYYYNNNFQLLGWVIK